MTTVNSVNTYIVPTTANEVTMPSQPAFLEVLGADDLNVTGDFTTFTIGTGNALTEVFDQNGDMTTGGTFTAPVTGRYYLKLFVQCGGITGVMDQQNLQITTSNRTFQINLSRPNTNINPATGGRGAGGGVVCDMDAADTATFTINIAFTGAPPGKVADVLGNANPAETFISGLLIA